MLYGNSRWIEVKQIYEFSFPSTLKLILLNFFFVIFRDIASDRLFSFTDS